MDLIKHIYRQIDFSRKTFGDGDRTHGIIAHIQKELLEIEEQPENLMEWIDVIILAIDGVWRMGFTPEQIANALELKQTINEGREWPDWREFTNGEPIEHIRQ